MCMARYFSPEDNPWGEYTRRSTWQEMQSQGNVIRLINSWPNMLNPNYSAGRQLQTLLQVKNIDDFLSLASVDFASENELCLLTREQLEAVWVEFTNTLKNNFLVLINAETVDESATISVRDFAGYFDVGLSGEVSLAIDTKNRNRTIYMNYPVAGSLSKSNSLEDIELGYPAARLDSYSGIATLVNNYLQYLQENGQDSRIKEIFTVPLVFETEVGTLTGLISASKKVTGIVGKDEDNGIYSFCFTTPERYSYGAGTVYEAIKSDRFPRFFGPFGQDELDSRNEIINYILNNNLASEFRDEIQSAVADLNAQIASFIDECPLDFIELCSKVYEGLKPEYTQYDKVVDITSFTGRQANLAKQKLIQLKNIVVELTTRNINFVGYTGSDIPLGWSYPITETDVANIYNPSSSRGTNLRTLYNSQRAVPKVEISLEDLETLEPILESIIQLQLRLPGLERNIREAKTKLERSQARLANLEDAEVTREKVNQAARAARAQVRERIARDIESTERSIIATSDNITRLQGERRDLIAQYLDE